MKQKCSGCHQSKAQGDFLFGGKGFKVCNRCRELNRAKHQRRADRRIKGQLDPNPRLSEPRPSASRFQAAAPSARVEEVESVDSIVFVEPRMRLPMSNVYVVTYAQNATPVHKGFLEALKVYCEHRKAELVVIPGRYKNPTSHWSKRAKSDDWWDASLSDYLFAGRAHLGGHLALIADMSIQPTASRPLSDLQVFAGEHSAIFGHPKRQMMTVATAKRYYPRILSTTGAVTIANYTDTKAGLKGEAHHTLGAIVVECDADGYFHMRNLSAMPDGSFIDLETEYSEDGHREADRPLAIICGDIHCAHKDDAVFAATFSAEDSIIRTLRPEKAVFHDVFDFEVRNHHNRKDHQDRWARASGAELDSVRIELERAINFIDEAVDPETSVYVVASNHDEAFDRWLRETHPHEDPKNAELWCESWLELYRDHREKGEWVPAFELWYRKLGEGAAKFLRRDDRLKIADIDCGFHGDEGLNGSRGNPSTYVKLGVKTVTGHTHVPGITDGNYSVGVTGSLDQGYNATPSSWMNSHCIIYANGRRVLIHVIDGRWRAA